MAHLVEEYAKHCGVKVSLPILVRHFFPLPFNRYITISPSNIPCLNYFYWEEVLGLLKENFKILGEDIKIVQIGQPNFRLNNIDCHIDNATVNQVNYLLSNSMLHLCPDDASCHVASAFDRPIVALYSHSKPDWSGPYWNIENEPSLLMPDFDGKKPSLNVNEEPSLINNIYPDKIAEEVFQKLGLSIAKKHKVAFIGDNYHFPLFEVVPDFTSVPDILHGKIVNLRDDRFSSNENLIFWLSNYRCTIITNREIPIEILTKYKINITNINFVCPHEEMPSLEYLHSLVRNSIRFNLFAKNASKDEISKLRNKYFDYGIDIYEKPVVPDGLDLNREDLYVKSKKVLLTNDGVFLSYFHWKNLDKLKKMGDNSAFIKVSNDDDFIEEINHFYIYEQ